MKPADRERARGIDWQDYRARLDRALAALQDQGHEIARAGPRRDGRTRPRLGPAPRPTAARRGGDRSHHLRAGRRALRDRDATRPPGRVARPGHAVPGAPDFLAGVVNLGGVILDIIDLKSVFGLGGPGSGSSEPSPVIVLGGCRDEFGVLADAVHDVTTLRIDAVLEPVGSVLGIDRQHLRGVTGTALIVLDGAGLIRDDRLVIDQGEGPGGPSRP